MTPRTPDNRRPPPHAIRTPEGKVVGRTNLSREEAQQTDRRALRVLGAREVATQTAEIRP